jgi:hypothetical protein
MIIFSEIGKATGAIKLPIMCCVIFIAIHIDMALNMPVLNHTPFLILIIRILILMIACYWFNSTPNSERTHYISILVGDRYPLLVSYKIYSSRANVYDSTEISKEGGATQILHAVILPATGFAGDPYYGIKFLDGNCRNLFTNVNFTMEILRNLNISAIYNLQIRMKLLSLF